MFLDRRKKRSIFSTLPARGMRRMVRDLVICVALPSILMIGATLIAQKSTPQQASDQQIADAIDGKLMSAYGNQMPFDVAVSNGTATLTGQVSSAEERARAEELVHSVPGVQAVNDQLVIASEPAAGENQTPEPGQAPPPPGQTEQPSPPQSSVMTPNPAPLSQPNAESNQPPMVTVPAGTPIYVLMLQSVGSRHTKPGERFRGVLAQNILLQNGAIAIPRGTVFDGTVIDARPPGHLRGRPKLALQLSDLQLGGMNYELHSSIWAHEGPGKGAQTAGTVAGTSVIGAFAGGVAGGGSGALLGGVLGGLGGAGISALSGGPRLFVPAESVLTFYVNSPLTVQEPTPGEVRAAAANIPYGFGRRPRPRPYYPYRPGYYPPPPPPGPPGGYPY